MLTKEQFTGIQNQYLKTVEEAGTSFPFSYPEDHGRLFTDIEELDLFPFSIVELTNGCSDGSWFEAHYYHDVITEPIIINSDVVLPTTVEELVNVYNDIMIAIDNFNEKYTITKAA